GDGGAEVGVVGEPHRDAAAPRILDRVDHELLEPRSELEVVQRDVERAPGGGEEVAQRLGHRHRLLAAVRQRGHRHHASMEFAEVLRRRKMVRSYTDEPVPRQTIARIVERARKAPTAGFSQGLRFVVVTEAEGRQAVARAGGEDWYTERAMPAWLSQAPVKVVV